MWSGVHCNAIIYLRTVVGSEACLLCLVGVSAVVGV